MRHQPTESPESQETAALSEAHCLVLSHGGLEADGLQAHLDRPPASRYRTGVLAWCPRFLLSNGHL